MYLDTCHGHDVEDMSVSDLRTWMHAAWGTLGERVADAWAVFNVRHFDGSLRPVPIVLTPTAPYGNWVGLTCGGGCQSGSRARMIYLTMPSRGSLLIADRGTLLHEMLHCDLIDRGLDTAHDGQPWRDGIVRLSSELGKPIVAERTKVGKVKVDGQWRSRRITPDGSLSQGEIAGWPHSVGLRLGALFDEAL